MTEEDVRRVAREEAQKVLKEHLALRRQQRQRREELEQRNHEAALEAAYGPHGQG